MKVVVAMMMTMMMIITIGNEISGDENHDGSNDYNHD